MDWKHQDTWHTQGQTMNPEKDMDWLTCDAYLHHEMCIAWHLPSSRAGAGSDKRQRLVASLNSPDTRADNEFRKRRGLVRCNAHFYETKYASQDRRRIQEEDMDWYHVMHISTHQMFTTWSFSDSRANSRSRQKPLTGAMGCTFPSPNVHVYVHVHIQMHTHHIPNIHAHKQTCPTQRHSIVYIPQKRL